MDSKIIIGLGIGATMIVLVAGGLVYKNKQKQYPINVGKSINIVDVDEVQKEIDKLAKKEQHEDIIPASFALSPKEDSRHVRFAPLPKEVKELRKKQFMYDLLNSNELKEILTFFKDNSKLYYEMLDKMVSGKLNSDEKIGMEEMIREEKAVGISILDDSLNLLIEKIDNEANKEFIRLQKAGKIGIDYDALYRRIEEGKKEKFFKLLRGFMDKLKEFEKSENQQADSVGKISSLEYKSDKSSEHIFMDEKQEEDKSIEIIDGSEKHNDEHEKRAKKHEKLKAKRESKRKQKEGSNGECVRKSRKQRRKAAIRKYKNMRSR